MAMLPLHSLRLSTVFALCFCLLGSMSIAHAQIIIDMPTDISYCEDEADLISIGPTSVTGGDGNYTYEWSPADNLSSPNSETTTLISPVAGDFQFTLTVRDGSDNMASADITVRILPSPIISADVQQPSCGIVGGGAINVITQGNQIIYEWSIGSTSPSITDLPAGIYCVTVTSFDGCQASDCYIITSNDPLVVDVTGVPNEPCPEQNIITITATGGVPPYTYTIIERGPNGGTVGNTSTITDLIDGDYSAIVTDAANCSSAVDFTVNQSLPAEIAGITVLDCATGTTELSIGNSATGNAITYLWTRPDGSQIEATSIIASEAGRYSLEVTNTELGCVTVVSTFVIEDLSTIENWINVRIDFCQRYILQGVLIEDYFGIIEYTWTTPSGTTIEALSIEPGESGLYTLETNIPGLNCNNISTVYIDLDDDICGNLSGFIRIDANENCTVEADELGVSNIIVTATSTEGNWNAISDANGFYSLDLPEGDYTITHTVPSTNWILCADTYSATMTAGGDIALNIPVQGLTDCPELVTELSAPFLRRCFSNYYTLSVCNYGTAIAMAPQVSVILDDFLDYQGASQVPTNVDGQNILFTLGDMPPGACKTIRIEFVVSCDSELGQTHCTTVDAITDPFCAPGGENWSGANLEVVASCDGSETIFLISNTGTGPIGETLQYIVIEDGIAMIGGDQGLPPIGVGEANTVRRPANGATYTIIIDQAIGHPYTRSISASIEGCGRDNQNSFTTGFVTQYDQISATPASTVLCMENRGAFDPNDKAALPKGYGDQNYIEPETELDYRIRFQNTGTDTAFTVVLRDTLSEWLDVQSLKVGNSSHNYKLTISQENILMFTFNNIQLPDSTTNEPASHGYVFFSISPKADAPLETVIENTAAIYFDFNEPIFTNTVFHTLGRNFILTDWRTISAVELGLNVFPNPTQERLFLQLEGLEDLNSRTLHLQIVNMQGQLVHQQSINSYNEVLDLQAWPAGVYLLQLYEQGQLLGNGKLVVE